MDTVIALSEGDMRKAVNLLQSISLSINQGAIVDEKMEQQFDANFIYAMTGNVSQAKIKEILQILMDDDIAIAFASRKPLYIPV